jgi:hypothetical protein
MTTITLSAIFDGEHIRLEDDYHLPKNARLLVTLVDPATNHDEEFRREWSLRSLHTLSKAYDEHEPDYGDERVIEPNPLYEER